MLKLKRRYQQAKVVFPDRADSYEEKIARLEDELRAIHACQRCGRPLKGEESLARGYGPECARKEEQETDGSEV